MGFLLNSYLKNIDSILGLIVAFMILYAAYGIIKEASKRILGVSFPEEMKNSISAICIKNTPEIKDLHNFKLHQYGKHIEVTFHCRLPEFLTLKKVHETISILENALLLRSSVSRL